MSAKNSIIFGMLIGAFFALLNLIHSPFAILPLVDQSGFKSNIGRYDVAALTALLIYLYRMQTTGVNLITAWKSLLKSLIDNPKALWCLKTVIFLIAALIPFAIIQNSSFVSGQSMEVRQLAALITLLFIIYLPSKFSSHGYAKPGTRIYHP